MVCTSLTALTPASWHPVASLLLHQVTDVSNPLKLDTVTGRLTAVCILINCYRLIARMVQELPHLAQRQPLFLLQSNSSRNITLNPSGAEKRIGAFETFAKAAGTSKTVLRKAYKAAADAAAARQGAQPFLVHAREGPTFSGHSMTVHTHPLGYGSTPETEEVGAEFQAPFYVLCLF